MIVALFGPKEDARIRDIVTFASREENLYKPNLGVPPPGDTPRHVLETGNVRCVFSITKLGGHLYRHLSVSMFGETGFLPLPIVKEIAYKFGFEGVWNDWLVGKEDDSTRKIIVVTQELSRRASGQLGVK
jgi:hypothetical protein